MSIELSIIVNSPKIFKIAMKSGRSMYVGKGWDKSMIPNIKPIPPPTIFSPGLTKGFEGLLSGLVSNPSSISFSRNIFVNSWSYSR